MAVPKRRASKGKVRRKRNTHYKRVAVKAIKTKGGYKRPHIEELIEI